MNTIIAKITAFFMSIIMLIFPKANVPKVNVDVSDDNTNYTFVFVHGLGGWGEDAVWYNALPYWGMMGGDMIKYLNARGYNTVAADVNPVYSAWDRACELYAQLTGTRVDYGKEHSERCNHARFGKDYSCCPLIENWNETNKINLLGHSFGGATILLLLDLLKDGSDAERNATNASELSGLFTGGKENWVYSETFLSAPLNGTTAYYVRDDIDNDKGAKNTERAESTTIGALIDSGSLDGRVSYDTAGYDLSVDGAMELLKRIEIVDDVYYFSQPCAVTIKDNNGNWTVDSSKVEFLFTGAIERIYSWTGTTPNGYYCDESWQENDGLVNTISAKAPFVAPQQPFDANDIKPGVYNVFDTYYGDHMSLMGGFFHTNNIREYYVNVLDIINNA